MFTKLPVCNLKLKLIFVEKYCILRYVLNSDLETSCTIELLYYIYYRSIVVMLGSRLTINRSGGGGRGGAELSCFLCWNSRPEHCFWWTKPEAICRACYNNYGSGNIEVEIARVKDKLAANEDSSEDPQASDEDENELKLSEKEREKCGVEFDNLENKKFLENMVPNNQVTQEKVSEIIQESTVFLQNRRRDSLRMLGWHQGDQKYRCRVCVKAKKAPLAKPSASRYLKHIKEVHLTPLFCEKRADCDEFFNSVEAWAHHRLKYNH